MRTGLKSPTQPEIAARDLVVHVDPELGEFRLRVADAQARLAELEAEFTREKARVRALQNSLFQRLADNYRKRDHLRLLVDHRRRLLDTLMNGREGEADQSDAEYQQAKSRVDQDYEEIAATANTPQLSADQQKELTQLWKKLVKLYHPDRFANDPAKLATYHKLTSAINRAKDMGDIETLREIAEDPNGFMLRNGWANLDFTDEVELEQLKKLCERLQAEITSVLKSLGELRRSPDFELCLLVEKKPGLLDELAAERRRLINLECEDLEVQALQLKQGIRKQTEPKTSVIK